MTAARVGRHRPGLAHIRGLLRLGRALGRAGEARLACSRVPGETPVPAEHIGAYAERDGEQRSRLAVDRLLDGIATSAAGDG